MTVSEITEDKKQIGLTPTGNSSLTQLMDAGLFSAETDAYKIAISYGSPRVVIRQALRMGAIKRSSTRLEAWTSITKSAILIRILRPENSERPYATAERLAELASRNSQPE